MKNKKECIENISHFVIDIPKSWKISEKFSVEFKKCIEKFQNFY